MSCEEAVGEDTNALPTRRLQGTFSFISRQLQGFSLNVPFFLFYFPLFPRYYSIGYENFQYQGPADIFLRVGGFYLVVTKKILYLNSSAFLIRFI
jgi:hypothetical protein